MPAYWRGLGMTLKHQFQEEEHGCCPGCSATAQLFTLSQNTEDAIQSTCFPQIGGDAVGVHGAEAASVHRQVLEHLK